MNSFANQTTDEPKSIGFRRAMLVVFLPFACGYFFSYFYRVINAIVAPNLTAEIGLNATELGLLSAAYFLTFAACQIPLGILLDRFGPRRVQGILYGIAGVGAFMFSISDSMITLMLSRGLIGIGVSGGLMAALKAIVQWFPKDKVPLVNGLYLVSGALGALAATLPFEYALQFMDWRGLFVILSIGTIAVGALIYFIVPDKPNATVVTSLREQKEELGRIYKDPYFWRIVPLLFTGVSANMAIQGLWAAPWLSNVVGLERAAVANHLFVVAIAMLFGFLFSGVFASMLQKVGVEIASTCALVSACNIVIMLSAVFQVLESSIILWAAVGFFGVQLTIVYAALASHFPETVVGRANTAANVLVFIMAFTYQFGIGAIIELWPADMNGTYPKEAYTIAFLATITTQILALIWYWLPIRSVTYKQKLPI